MRAIGVRSDRVTQQPDYTVRRVTAALFAVLVIVAAAIAVDGARDGFGGGPAAAAETTPVAEQTPRWHVAEPGDTMWSIATQHRGDVERDRYVDALIGLNGGTMITVGQSVVLP